MIKLIIRSIALSIFPGLIFFTICVVNPCFVHASAQLVQEPDVVTSSKDNIDQSKNYVLGEIIIKFKKTSPLAKQAKELFDSERPFSSVTDDDTLDLLAQKYQLQEVVQINKGKSNFAEIMGKYPERSKRIPKGAKLTEITPVYKLIFADSQMDIPAVCITFEKNSHVEYAQPNYLAAHHQKEINQ